MLQFPRKWNNSGKDLVSSIPTQWAQFTLWLHIKTSWRSFKNADAWALPLPPPLHQIRNLLWSSSASLFKKKMHSKLPKGTKNPTSRSRINFWSLTSLDMVLFLWSQSLTLKEMCNLSSGHFPIYERERKCLTCRDVRSAKCNKAGRAQNT